MADLNTCSPEEFLKAFRRRSLDAKRTMIEELGQNPSQRSVDILIEILEGDSWHLRDLAGRALARLGALAVPALRRILVTGVWYTRSAAARTLGKIGATESLSDLVQHLADTNDTVRGACLASIADLVRGGQARDTARLFWNQGARRADEYKRLLMAVHPDAGGAVAELLSDPSSFLKEVVPEDTPDTEGLEDADRKNA